MTCYSALVLIELYKVIRVNLIHITGMFDLHATCLLVLQTLFFAFGHKLNKKLSNADR